MTPIELQEAQNTFREIQRIQHLLLRIECGTGFGQLKFIGHENKTMDAIEEYINYPEVMAAYKKCLEKKRDELQEKFEKM